MKLDSFHQLIAAAEPAGDELDRRWARSRVERGLFASAHPEPPHVGRFVLGDKLGVGGMGVVFAARDPELERDVAVKLVRVNNPADREQTHLEAQALARLSHPNVVSVHDVGLIADQVYIVMEFVRGETLRDYAGAAKRPVHEVVAAYQQACDGLAAAHAEQLIHRDFKPDNAVVGQDGRVRIIDFGLAQDRDRNEAASNAGTARYMAPEQAQGLALTAAADQFSLCASLREALAAVCEGDPPTWLTAICERGMAAAPEDRFATMTEVALALGRDPRVRRRRRIAMGAGAAAMVAAFAGGAVAFSSAEAAHCEGGEALIESAWPAAHWSESAAEFARAGEFGRDVAEQMTERLAAFRTRWSRVHREACLANHRGEQSDELLDRQMVCLSRGKRAFETTAQLVAAATEEDLAQLAVVAQSLPAPTHCLDLEAMTASTPPAPAIAERVKATEQALAAVIVNLDAGKFEIARETSARLATEAESLGYPPLLAEAKLLHGRALLSLMNYSEAIPRLAEASEVAIASGADATGVEAWARWAYATGITGDPQVPLAGVGVVRGLAQRVGDDTFAYALLENNIGTLHIASGDPEAARRALRRAAEAARRLEGAGALEALHAVGNLAIVTPDPAERDELAAESVARLTALVSKDHPQTLRAVRSRAQLAAPDVALAVLQPACDVWRGHHPQLRSDAAGCYLELAWLYEANGDDNAAASAAANAAELSPARYPLALGLERLFAGRFADAIAAATPLAAGHDGTSPLRWWEKQARAEILMVLGRAYQRSDDERGPGYLARAVASLRSIRNPVPLVEQRLQTAERWQASR